MRYKRFFIPIRKNLFATFFVGLVIGFVLSRIFLDTSELCSNSLVIIPNQAVSNIDKMHETYHNIIETVTDNQQTLISEDDVLCKIPDLDPYDPEIAKFVTHPLGIHCNQVQPFLTLVDYDGVLGYNESEYIRLNLDDDMFVCYYATFDRKPGFDDMAVEYDEWQRLVKLVKLTKDAVEVICNYTSDGSRFYWNVHVHPVARFDRLFAAPTDDQLSVIFLLFDSISFSALKRNLPKTYDYTKNVMRMKYFNAFNKIGSNSFPNQVPMLTGMRMYYEQEDMQAELPKGFDYYKTQFDSWPFIWKFFNAKGYATGFNSEWPTLSLFNYEASGFSKKPVDFYYLWYWLAVDKVKSDQSSTYCFNNEPLPKINTDLIKRHVISMQDQLQFMFTCVSETTHNSTYSEIERQDEYLLNLWKDLFEKGHLSKTVIIFASDHGLRMGKQRATYVGSIEDKLPFYSMWFPERFYKLHPEIKKNIEMNTNRLTTPFDVYETLKDIANGNYYGQQKPIGSRGLSQLYPIPTNRTCKTAGIADHWCACNREIALPTVNNSLADEAATFFVEHINWILRDHKDKCFDITFTKLNYFRLVEFSDAESRIPNQRTYLLGIETAPNEATFDAYVNVRLNGTSSKNEWALKGGLTRISAYWRHSLCIKGFWEKHFCACK